MGVNEEGAVTAQLLGEVASTRFASESQTLAPAGRSSAGLIAPSIHAPNFFWSSAVEGVEARTTNAERRPAAENAAAGRALVLTERRVAWWIGGGSVL